MDALPLNSMSETTRQDQNLADVARLNPERQSRGQDLLNADLQENREEWNATQVAPPEMLFPFSDNLTTLRFISASGLSEAQRERRTSSLSLQGVYVTACTLKNVKAVFVELFCTPKCSIGNPSLRVNTYAGNTSRTFIVEDFIEDEFGHWATSRSNWRTR